MSFAHPTRLELAMHEAGHAYAYAALVKYGEPEELGLDVDADGAVHGWCRRTTLLHREVRLEDVTAECLPWIKWQAAAEVVIAIAGPVAEFRHRHRSRAAGAVVIYMNADVFLAPDAFDVDGDFARIRATLDYIGTVDEVASLRELGTVADEVVDANWPSIRRLGRHLLERGRLDADEIGQWFDAHPVQRHGGGIGMGDLVRR